jgi:hypothetical protein
MCVCVCVCVRERERVRQRERGGFQMLKHKNITQIFSPDLRELDIRDRKYRIENIT